MMRFVITSVALLILASPVFADGMTAADVYKASEPSIMVLDVHAKDGKEFTGTAFMAIKDGMAVTAWHMVENAASVTAKFSDGQEFDVSGLVDNDPKRDLALIKVKEFGRKLLTLSPNTPDVGSKAYVIGAPEGLDFTVSDGLISQIRQDSGINYYQFSSPASHGNSGGPVLNDKGDVIGIVSFQFNQGQNLNFAIPSTYALGLDGTLPTKPWDQVKDVPPGPTATTSTQDNDAVDAKLANAMAAVWDTDATIDHLMQAVARTKNGFQKGPGTDAYGQRERLKDLIDDFASLTSSDPVRSRLIDVNLNALKHSLEAITDYIEAVTRAQDSGAGWDGPANDLIQEMFAACRNCPQPSDADIAFVTKSEVFRKTQPVLAQMLDYQLDKSKAGYLLRVGFTVENSCYLSSVNSGGNADKMGLRLGDLLVSVNDQPVSTYYDFLDKIFDNRGKKVKISVTRDGKSKSWNTDVPN